MCQEHLDPGGHSMKEQDAGTHAHREILDPGANARRMNDDRGERA
jgi:hypothetical protein